MAIFEPHPRSYYDNIINITNSTITNSTITNSTITVPNNIIITDSTFINTTITTKPIDDNFSEVFDEYFRGTGYENYVFFDIEKTRSATSIGMLTFNDAEEYLFDINNWCIENEISLPRVHVSDSYIGYEKIAFGFKTKEDLVRFELRWM